MTNVGTFQDAERKSAAGVQVAPASSDSSTAAKVAPRYPINAFKSATAKTPQTSRHATVAQIAELLRRVQQVARKELAPLLTFVKYREGAASRGISDIESAHAVYGDIDDNFDPDVFEAGLAELEQAGAQVIAYQTYSHTPQAPRWRVFVFLDEPISPADYRACWEGLNALFGGMLDGNAKDSARLNYWPSCPPGETREVRTLNIGAPS